MCQHSVFADFFDANEDQLHIFTIGVWVLDIAILLFFALELYLRDIKCRSFGHAYLMVILSMLSSILSSTFFLFSNHNSTICSFAPIIAISLRTMSKTFTWGLYIVRGQLVMEALENIVLSKFAQKAPYILAAQCIVVISLILIFTETSFLLETNSCTVFYPLPLLISSALVGEIFYGLGFMLVFYHAMTASMDHVYSALRQVDIDKTKAYLRHHIIIYFIQLLASILFLCFVSLCVTFLTLHFFEAELLICNFCLLLLFRKKGEVFKKMCGNSRTIALSATNSFRKKHPHYSQRQISFRNLRMAAYQSKFIPQYSCNSNYILSNKWRSNKEVKNIKHAIQIHRASLKNPAAATAPYVAYNTPNTNSPNTISADPHSLPPHNNNVRNLKVQMHCVSSNSSCELPSLAAQLSSHGRSVSATNLDEIIHKFDTRERIRSQSSKRKSQSTQSLDNTQDQNSSFPRIQSFLRKLKIGSPIKKAGQRDKEQALPTLSSTVSPDIDRKALFKENFASVEPVQIHSASNSKDAQYWKALFDSVVAREQRYGSRDDDKENANTETTNDSNAKHNEIEVCITVTPNMDDKECSTIESTKL